MFEKRKYKKEIKKCRDTIEEIERKRSRSQSALVQAILLQEQEGKAPLDFVQAGLQGFNERHADLASDQVDQNFRVRA